MPGPFKYFGGIDFSGAREPLANLWTALGREEGGRLRILSVRPHAFRQDLAAFVLDGWRALDEGTGPILWGADFPFGLPAAASDAVGAGDWQAVIDWVGDRPADEVRAATSEFARSVRLGEVPGALAPLDLRLYKQTVEGMRWLQHLRELADVSIEPQSPSAEAATTLIEVYPSGTAQELGLPRRRAPGRPGEARARMAALRTFLEFTSPDNEAAVVNLEDAWDATVACLTAFLCRDDVDQPSRQPEASHQTVAREGWIYRPPAVLATASVKAPRG